MFNSLFKVYKISLILYLSFILSACSFSNKFQINNKVVLKEIQYSIKDFPTALSTLEIEKFLTKGVSDSIDKSALTSLIYEVKTKNNKRAKEIAKTIIIEKTDSLSWIKNSILQYLNVYDYIDSINNKYNNKVGLPEISTTDTNYNEIEFTFVNNKIYLNIDINGNKYKMLFDSGFPYSQINSSKLLANTFDNYKINLDSVNSGSIDANGFIVNNKYNEYYKLNYKLSNLLILNHLFEVKGDSIIKLFYDHDGVLGWDIISMLDFELDFNKNKFKFRKSFKNNNLVINNKIYFFGGPLIETYDNLGYKMKLIIDFGSNISYLNKWYFDLRNINPKTLKKRDAISNSVYGTKEYEMYMTENVCFNLGNKSLHFENVIYQENLPFMGNITIDGLLGADLFTNHIVKFDYLNNIFEIE